MQDGDAALQFEVCPNNGKFPQGISGHRRDSDQIPVAKSWRVGGGYEGSHNIVRTIPVSACNVCNTDYMLSIVERRKKSTHAEPPAHPLADHKAGA
jgi:hypothetical protein